MKNIEDQNAELEYKETLDEIAELEYKEVLEQYASHVQILKARIKELEELLQQHAIAVPSFRLGAGTRKMNFPELTADEQEFLRRAGKEATEENVLGMRIAIEGMAAAIAYGDIKWIKRHNRKMKSLENQPQLARLKALYGWVLNNPPKYR